MMEFGLIITEDVCDNLSLACHMEWNLRSTHIQTYTDTNRVQTEREGTTVKEREGRGDCLKKRMAGWNE